MNQGVQDTPVAEMWRFEPSSGEGGGGGVMSLQLAPPTLPLTIDVAESSEERIQRLISENPVIIFSRSACYMCHVMKQLFSTLGVHPTVIELEEEEMGVLAAQDGDMGAPVPVPVSVPVAYIGGTKVGEFSNLVALHLSGDLVPKLVEVRALWNEL